MWGVSAVDWFPIWPAVLKAISSTRICYCWCPCSAVALQCSCNTHWEQILHNLLGIGEEKWPREAGGARGSTCCWPLKWAGWLCPLDGPVSHGHPTQSLRCWLASGATGKCWGCSQRSDLSLNGAYVLVLYGDTFYCHVSKQEDS